MNIKTLIGIATLALFTGVASVQANDLVAAAPGANVQISSGDNSTSTPESEWVFTLGGTGQTYTRDASTSFGTDFSIGQRRTVILPIELGFRQGVAYDGSSSTILNSRVYLDVTVLQYENIEVFGGANVGFVYGNIPSTYVLAPEAGVRWWFANNVCVLGRVEAPVQLNRRFEFTESLNYFLGVQVKF